MSSAPTPRSPPTPEPGPLTAAIAGHVLAGIRAAAFWAAALLPFVLLAGLAIGAAEHHQVAVVGALALNVACAVVGHDHAPAW